MSHPQFTTVASGLCTSAPVPKLVAIGMKPTAPPNPKRETLNFFKQLPKRF